MIPIPPTAAEIERLLMRFPFSARLKYELKKAKTREARQLKRARAKLMRSINGRLKGASVEVLRQIVAELEAASD